MIMLILSMLTSFTQSNANPKNWVNFSAYEADEETILSSMEQDKPITAYLSSAYMHVHVHIIMNLDIPHADILDGFGHGT